ncbi:hypothetical protein THAOC_10168 [Thalassiosira oceanica]|uniref:Uncharacterized protein n=1 Tax=Thalassiosira oceanica TaxID=159749 RepID=K0SUM6_THAOC|nr:hypothetical protein THAOC_10168 [Thalassiosira oceanica]|eukprot:EJK68634.1 hypothetical protein THAOC_10168 [Thalassiosira oceanica]
MQTKQATRTLASLALTDNNNEWVPILMGADTNRLHRTGASCRVAVMPSRRRSPEEAVGNPRALIACKKI